MIPRGRIDIGWSDLLSAATARPSSRRDELKLDVQARMGPPDEFIPTLSVRSGFDLLLETLDFPPGSEVLVSAVTIRDMGRIVREHGLVPVPVDLDMAGLALQPGALERALSPRSRAVLVAHLFGSRMPLEHVGSFCRRHGLLLIEDCAQAFVGPSYAGGSESDVVMFSFGPIKTHTCLGGALLRIREPRLRKRMLSREHLRPTQRDGEYRVRALKYLGIRSILDPAAYSAFVALTRAIGSDHDRVLGSAVRGFAGSDFFRRIRRQPSGALLATMARRLHAFDGAAIAARGQRARSLLERLPALRAPGRRAREHTHWVLPIEVADPGARMRELWRLGFDATRGATSIEALSAPAGRAETEPTEAKGTMARVLFLPTHPGMNASRTAQLADVVSTWPPVETREASHA